MGKYSKYLGSGNIIKQAIKKYGKQNFIRDILQICNNSEELKQQEIYWIKHFKEYDKKNCYNIANGGQGFEQGNIVMLGRKLRPETIEKLKKIHKGFKHTQESKNKISESQKLNNKITGLRNNFSPMKDKHHSEESKLKISIGHKGKPSHRKGKHHSIESKIRMSNSAKKIQRKRNEFGRYC